MNMMNIMIRLWLKIRLWLWLKKRWCLNICTAYIDISDSFYLCVLKVSSANIRHISQGFKDEVAPFDVSQHQNFRTKNPKTTCFGFKRKAWWFPPKMCRVCGNLGDFQLQKNSRRFAPVQRVCGFAANRPWLWKTGPAAVWIEKCEKFVPWIRENWREKKGRFSWRFSVLVNDFPVEFILLWRTFAELNH